MYALRVHRIVDANAFGVDITCLNHWNNQIQLMQTASRVIKSVWPCAGKVTIDSKFETTLWAWGLQMSCYHLELVLLARHPCCRLKLASLPLWSPSAYRRIYAGDDVVVAAA
jgi:hypothetical protein